MEISSVKGIFLRYILMPLFAVIMMVILGAIRRNKPAIKIKTIIIYVLLCSLCLAIPGIFGFAGNLFNPYWYLIAQIVYLILGIIHVNLSDKYFKKHFSSLTKSILFESILSLTCIGFGGYLFYLIFNWMSKGTGYPIMAATSMLIFVVPLVFHYCYIQLISIPVDIYKTWRYSPDQRLPDFEGADFDRLMVLNVELSKIWKMQTASGLRPKHYQLELLSGTGFTGLLMIITIKIQTRSFIFRIRQKSRITGSFTPKNHFSASENILISTRILQATESQKMMLSSVKE